MRRLFALSFLLLVGWLVWAVTSSLPRRTTAVVDGDPVAVVSWDEVDGTLTNIEIPGPTVVDATRGYGAYPLGSLWRLGELDGGGGEILATSAQEALAVPVPYYVGGAQKRTARMAFSFSQTWNLIRGKVKTNLPISRFLAFSWRLAFVRPDHVTTLTFAPGRGIASEVAPDGSSRLVMDQNQVDILMGSAFEDEEIRREGYSVAVFNTTSASSLGTRVGRLLAHLGFLVVTIANDEPAIDQCEVVVSARIANSVSVRTIQDILGCTMIRNEEAKRADILVRMGSTYAKTFLPYSP